MVQALCRRNGTSPYSRSGSTKAELAAHRSRGLNSSESLSNEVVGRKDFYMRISPNASLQRSSMTRARDGSSGALGPHLRCPALPRGGNSTSDMASENNSGGSGLPSQPSNRPRGGTQRARNQHKAALRLPLVRRRLHAQSNPARPSVDERLATAHAFKGRREECRFRAPLCGNRL